ncbi:hypothetical protein Tco_1314293, partial [Tanacetum coccineum]
MPRSTVKKLEEPLDEPERELHRRRKAASHQQWNESLAIAGRNLFDDEPSSVINTETIATPPIKSLSEYSSPNFAGFQNSIVYPKEQTGKILDSQDIGDIYDDPSILRFYQNDDIPSWRSIRRRSEGEEGPEWVVRSKFEDSLCNFMLEKALHAKGLGEMLDQQWRGMHNQFSKILATFRKSQTPTPNPNALNFAITTRSGTTTLDPPYPTPSNSTTADDTNKTIEEERLENEETTTIQDKEVPQSPTLYHPSKSSSVPYPSRLKKQKKDDVDERLLSIFRQIHVNLPFLEAMIHMPNGAKVLKNLLSHKEKLEKAASSVKLN